MTDNDQSDDVVDMKKAIPADAPKIVVGGKGKEDPIDPDGPTAEGTAKDNSGNEDKQNKKEKSSSGSMTGALRSMISFFTIIRVDVKEKDVHDMEDNFWLAPMAGFIVGLMAAIVGLILWWIGFNPFVVAVIMLATVYVLSKFLHFDGLVDFGDALVATGDREKRIRALKDTAIGAGGFGVAFMVTLVSISLFTSMGTLVVVLFWPIEVLIKNAMVAAAANGEPGNGMASRQVAKTTFNSVFMSSILAFILAVVALLIAGGICQLICGYVIYSTEMLLKCIAILFVGLIVSILAGITVAEIANRKLGFVNGDVLGATNEISRVAIILFMMAIGFGIGLF